MPQYEAAQFTSRSPSPHRTCWRRRASRIRSSRLRSHDDNKTVHSPTTATKAIHGREGGVNRQAVVRGHVLNIPAPFIGCSSWINSGRLSAYTSVTLEVARLLQNISDCELLHA